MSFELENTENATCAKFLGRQFEMPLLEQDDWKAPVVVMMMNAGGAAANALALLGPINTDNRLTKVGKEEKTSPIKAEAITRIAAAAGQLKADEERVASIESAMFAVPVLNDTAAAVAIEDREIRDWWRALSTDQRTKTLDQVQREPHKHERLLIAILRAPAPLAILGHEAQFARTLWEDGKRKANPDVFAVIDHDRQVIETVKRGLAHLGGITMGLIEWERSRVIDAITSSKYEPAKKGYELLGFSDQDAAASRRRVAAQAQRT